MKPFGHWKFYSRNLDPETAVGFVYMIVDKDTHRKYIGRKWFRGRGRSNRGVVSNWKSYTSSSTELNRLIDEKGKGKFVFIILEQYFSVSGLAFAETWSQVVCETPNKNNEFLNRFIDKITFKVVEPVSEQHKKRLTSWMEKFPFPKPEPPNPSS